MKRTINILRYCLLFSLITLNVFSQNKFNAGYLFDKSCDSLQIIGRGVCEIKNGTLYSKDAYVAFGDNKWKDYRVSFAARTPASQNQVQIWAGFRAYNRYDRYMIGLRGGLQNNLYLSRMGYMGTDEFLALRKLDFHPEPGTWYNLSIEVCNNRIRVFLNNEALPRIDIVDKNSQLAPSGSVTLGGGWIETEFDNLTVEELPENYMDGKAFNEYTVIKTPQEKEKKRQAERAAYQPLKINAVTDTRTEVSLNGNWLFIPEYELSDEQKAVAPSEPDQKWHVMHVPDFWNPIRIWLHGETFGPHAKGVSDVYYQNETNRCAGYTFDYKKTSTAWYRQWVELPENIKGRNMELIFDAVSKIAEVWINGSPAGKHIGMFGEFRINGTNMFKPGKNLIVVKVIRDYSKEISEAGKVVDVAVSVEVTNKMLKDLAHGFYGDDPAGIWQPVSLLITDPFRINDVYIKPNLNGASFEATLKNNTRQKKSFSVVTNIVDKQTHDILYHGVTLTNCELNAGEEKVFAFSVSDLKPKLWTPRTPNLYDFTFSLVSEKKEFDRTTICSGFRTFEAKNGFFLLNGQKYWLKGANHTPFALAPNSVELADTFYKLMKAGNIEVTRTHTTPYNEVWMDAADRNGIGISFEGTWSWLMLGSSMPDMKLIDLWADEFLGLLKKYRNHPSLLFWTVNNEMKFYDNDPDFERAKKKMKIISDVVKRMRTVDATRPICFDSNYKRNEKKFGKDFFRDIDDGDIDDIHSYINWYDHTIFKQFNGEFQKSNKNEGRPLISQELSTGYPNNETGHATRFYTIVHQNPQSLIGNLAYENNNPSYFLDVNSFITGELAEAMRRTNDKSSGFLHFALLTWFRNVYNPSSIEPYPTYYSLKRAFQPVLVSAELWGRHFYVGEKLPARICIINDKEDGTDLASTTLLWELVTNDGLKLASGMELIPAVKYYTREWIVPAITIPALPAGNKTEARLLLKLADGSKIISENEYKILIASKEWSNKGLQANKDIVLVDFNNKNTVLDFLKISYKTAENIASAFKYNAGLYIFSGLDQTKNCTREDLRLIRMQIAKGAKVFMVNSENAVVNLYPEYVTGFIVPTEGDIVNMEVPESHVFDGIDPLELRYFNDNNRNIPTVCHVAFKVNRNPNVEVLASHIKIHGYINGEMDRRSHYMETIKGFPLLKIHDNGTLMVSAMSFEKGTADPVPGRLLTNIISAMLSDFK